MKKENFEPNLNNFKEKAFQIEFSKKEKERKVFNIDQKIEKIDQEIENLKGKNERTIRILQIRKELLNEQKKDIEEKIPEEIKTLTQELDSSLLSEILKEGKEEFLKIAKNFLENKREISLYKNLIDLERFHSDLLPTEKRKIIEKCQTKLEELEKTRQDLEGSSLEGFIAVNLLEIRNLRRQFSEGIIEVPSVKEKVKEIKEFLSRDQIPFVYGETGTGKTEVAIKIAKELSGKEPEILSGSEKTTYEELVGFLALTIGEEIDPKKIPQKIEEAIKEFENNNPHLDSQTKEKQKEMIKEVLLKRFSQKPTITEYRTSRTFKALEEGRMVIIDEANMIPPGILSAYNRAFDEIRKKGVINIPLINEKIFLKEKREKGFPSFILTGNITPTSTNRYKRFILDPALRDRVIPIEYPTPDQETDPSKKHTDSEIPRDLYTIGMISLVDRYGVLRAPRNAPDQIWRLSQVFKVFQNAFAGKTPLKIKGEGGISLDAWPEKNHASMRKFLDILESWQKDGYQYEIDHYIWQYLIQPSLDTPQEAISFYQILQSIYDFFSREKWPPGIPKIARDKVEKIELEHPSKENLKNQEEIISFDFKTLIESLFAKNASVLITQKGKEIAQIEKQKEVIIEIENYLLETNNFLTQEQEKIDQVCKIKKK